MSNPASTKVHTHIGHPRSLCGHGHADSVLDFSEFFARSEASQCSRCVEAVRKRGNSIAALRRRFQRADTPAASARPADKTSLLATTQRHAATLYDKTIAVISANEIDINRFERLCKQLSAIGLTFTYRVTPSPYAISYSIKLDSQQSSQLNDLLTELTCQGYTDQDPAFPTLSGMRAQEISGPDLPSITLNYIRPEQSAHTHRAPRMEESRHASHV